MTAALAGSLVVLALIDSTSFGTLLIPLWFLSAPGRVRVGRVLLFLATVAGAYLLVGVALITGAGALAGTFGGLADSPAAAWAQLVLGVGLLLAGILLPLRKGRGPGRAARWRERATGEADAPGRSRGGSSAGLMTLSLTAVVLELPTMLPYLAATGLITASALGWTQSAVVLAGYCLVMVAPALALLAARVLARWWVEPVLARLAAWTERGSGEPLAWVVAIIGVLLARDAIARLPGLTAWLTGLGGG